MTSSLAAHEREELTKSGLREIRNQGMIPGVVYGEQAGNTLISVSEKELHALLRGSHAAVLDLEIEGQGRYPVMINELQRDSILGHILHIDFHQINLDQAVKTSVRLEFRGEPEGVGEGGILSTPMNELAIRCKANEIPESIAVDISALKMGESLLVRDLNLPAGVEAQDHEDEVVVTVMKVQKLAPEEVEELEADAQAADAGDAAEADRTAAVEA